MEGGRFGRGLREGETWLMARSGEEDTKRPRASFVCLTLQAGTRFK